jgi:hypothetical protein
MDLPTITEELYGLPPNEFTSTRDALAAEAREAGDRELASSVKQLRKPSAGAWVANMLVREQATEIGRLIHLGEDLRSTRNLDGEQIRRATRDKTASVAKLLRQAKAIAKRAGLLLSAATEQDLESTLDAAFSDPESAAALRQGSLTSGLHYSGLGFGGATPTRSDGAGGRSGGPSAPSADVTSRAKLRTAWERATREAEQADVEAEKARRAVVSAEADLKRLRATLSVADRKSKGAHKKASDAKKRVDALKGRTGR